MTRLGRLLLDVPPQANDEIIDGARVGILVEIPDIFEDRFSRNGMPDILDQVAEQFGFHEGQLERLASNLQSQILEVNDFVSEAKCFR